MSYFDDDYFDEPSEFERQVDEFKASLVMAVKQEHKDEMERLRTENEGLQSVKRRLTEIKSEHAAAIQELKRKEAAAERMALSKLLDSTKLIMWSAEATYIEREKCFRCNDNRQIEYTKPSGAKAYENCRCSEKDIFFAPKEQVRCEFTQRSRGGPVTAWYKPIELSCDRVHISDVFSRVKQLYDGDTPYPEVRRRDTMFNTEEDCQKYCDWLNANKGAVK